MQDKSQQPSKSREELSLLQNLSEPQKHYVVQYLFPTLVDAMNLFMMEAQRSSHYEEFMKQNYTKPTQSMQQIQNQQPTIDAISTKSSSFQSYNYQPNVDQKPKVDQMEQKRNQLISSRSRFSSGTSFNSAVSLNTIQFDPVQQFQEAFVEASKSQKNRSKLNNDTNSVNSPLVRPSDQYLQTKRRSVFSRPYETLDEMQEFTPPVHQKSEEQLQKLMEILKTSFLTKNLSLFELKIIADAMYLKKFQRNDLIIRYGDIGQEYFILDSGVVEVLVYQDGVDPNDPLIFKKVKFSKFLKPFVGFGEIALLYNDKRTASVRAADVCDTWVLEGKVFKHIIIKATITRRNIELQFIDSINVFKDIDRFNKMTLIDALEPKKFSQGDTIFQQGSEGDNFYILEEGEVDCYQKVFGQNEPKLIRTLQPGDHFGEIALIGDCPRTLTVKVKSTNCKLLALSKVQFLTILPIIEPYLKKDWSNINPSMNASQIMPTKQSSFRAYSLQKKSSEEDESSSDNSCRQGQQPTKTSSFGSYSLKMQENSQSPPTRGKSRLVQQNQIIEENENEDEFNATAQSQEQNFGQQDEETQKQQLINELANTQVLIDDEQDGTVMQEQTNIEQK
ncbi:camp-dependent protein kinase regulatory [Stylonychia lemnae]|uniref:Camp-dependent protein kinase regulatory n=1 Tax=Stylonychia lemnae TaxID=5949 RepID=A0A078APZ8_STYLE|nr:camp-dependent protein kinase regulatory [Stylonychia lemnae]|eukprot:CDW84420.1 camp-dependent protein kinase regulatory [Stylonychia lemnae]